MRKDYDTAEEIFLKVSAQAFRALCRQNSKNPSCGKTVEPDVSVFDKCKEQADRL
jgi:hypothetical protein